MGWVYAPLSDPYLSQPLQRDTPDVRPSRRDTSYVRLQHGRAGVPERSGEDEGFSPHFTVRVLSSPIPLTSHCLPTASQYQP